jgi:hypothetical protein
VGEYGLSYGGIIVIWKTENLALLPYYFAQGCIMDMTDLREEVVFNLEIQAAYEPGNNSVPRRKVGRGPDLMDGPFGTYYFVRSIGYIEPGLFNYMRQLKNHR